MFFRRPGACALFAAFALMCALPSCSKKAAAPELTIFCGSAVKPEMDELVKIYGERTGTRVAPVYGGSGEVLSQMELSRSGDVFVSGSPDFMIKARRKGLVDLKTEKVLAWLVPAIIVRKGNPKNIRSLEDLARPGVAVGVGNPDSVCVGAYAVEILEKNKLTKRVVKNIKAVTSSCSSVAALIAMKKVDAVIGWRDFANWMPGEADVVPLNAGEIPRIAYVSAAVSTNSKRRAAAEKFVRFLASKEARAVFEKHGGITDKAEALLLAPGAAAGGEYIPPRGIFGGRR